jgi:heme oxygenase
MSLKDLTWKHHKNAERQAFVKELLGGISQDRYATFLFNQRPQYDILENFALLHDLLDFRRTAAIHKDFLELWTHDPHQPPTLPVVKEYTNHIISIKDDPDKLMAHVYVRHMGDLSGGQLIAKRVPGGGELYKFDEDVNVLKENIRARCNDSMADEAKICFDFATKMFQQMMDIK